MPDRNITPRQVSSDTWRVSFELPSCPDMLAVFRAFLYSLENIAAWEQIEGTIAPNDAVEIARAINESVVIEK